MLTKLESTCILVQIASRSSFFIRAINTARKKAFNSVMFDSDHLKSIKDISSIRGRHQDRDVCMLRNKSVLVPIQTSEKSWKGELRWGLAACKLTV